MTTLVGTGRLIRLILRRDRIRLPAWILVLAAAPYGVANAFLGLYATEAARNELVASLASNPAMVALLGPVYDSTIGALTAWRIGTIGSLLVGLMAVLAVIRHTRDDEETGRRELLGATVVGRHAPLTAALLVVTGAGLVIGLLVAGGLASLGLPTAGSVAYGLGFAAVTAVFAAVGGACAQLTEGGGSARGLAVGMLGIAFLLRAAGDGGEAGGLGWLSWLSPIGWFTRFQPFADEQWWVLVLSIALALFFGSLAYSLSAHRDIGAGAFPPHIGPASASASLSGPIGLAWRLQRASLLGWSAGLAVVAAVYGSIANSIGDILTDNPQLAEIFERLGGEQGITDAFFSTAAGIFALIAAAYSVSTALRLRVEEEGLRAEPVLATATPRVRWVNSHLAFATLGPALMLIIAGLVMGISYGSIIGDIGGQVPRTIGAAVIQVPAVWVLTGATAGLFGLAPRVTALSWALLVAFLLLGQLGQILQLPQWAINLSPFTHVPALPTADVSPAPLAILTAIAAGLIGTGLIGFRHRDVGTA